MRLRQVNIFESWSSQIRVLPDASEIPGRPFVIAFEEFVDGLHVHVYLAEMTREVFDGRDGNFITIGEMPGVTPEQARLYTNPARGELNMVFQFEHVSVDKSPTNKFDCRGLDLVVLTRSLHRVAGGVGGYRLEQPVLEHPR
jgi:oligo-1,6-glucosidase